MHLALGMAPDNTNNVSYILWTRQIYKLPYTVKTLKKKILESYRVPSCLPYHLQEFTTRAILKKKETNIPQYPVAPRYAKVWGVIVHSLILAYAKRLFLDLNPWPTNYQGQLYRCANPKTVVYLTAFFSVHSKYHWHR